MKTLRSSNMIDAPPLRVAALEGEHQVFGLLKVDVGRYGQLVGIRHEVEQHRAIGRPRGAPCVADVAEALYAWRLAPAPATAAPPTTSRYHPHVTGTWASSNADTPTSQVRSVRRSAHATRLPTTSIRVGSPRVCQCLLHRTHESVDLDDRRARIDGREEAAALGLVAQVHDRLEAQTEAVLIGRPARVEPDGRA